MINPTIIRFTTMSACLDPLKLVYVAMLGFVMPIGMKIASMLHGASDSQTFEMLTGKVGVAFVLMVLCLGLAGNSSTQGRGGEYLALVFSRPVSRCEYVISKWVTITIIGGGLAGLQNLIIAAIGFAFGEAITGQALACSVVERFMDAALISAAMILSMLNKNYIFQIVSIVSFYIWLAGQTIPPVSVAGVSGGGIEDASIEATKFMLSMSQYIADLILPTINIYDLINTNTFAWAPIIAYVSAVTLYLAYAVAVINRREFFYGSN